MFVIIVADERFFSKKGKENDLLRKSQGACLQNDT